MNFIRNSAAVLLLTGFGLVTSTSNVQAQSFQHVDSLAIRLQRQTQILHREVHQHFRLTPSYVHLDRDVAAMQRLARHIHAVAHQGNIHHLRHDVEQLDRSFHHIESVVSFLRRTRQIDWRTLRHFRIVMGQVSQTLHHLRQDLQYLDPHHGHHHSSFGPGFGIYSGH